MLETALLHANETPGVLSGVGKYWSDLWKYTLCKVPTLERWTPPFSHSSAFPLLSQVSGHHPRRLFWSVLGAVKDPTMHTKSCRMYSLLAIQKQIAFAEYLTVLHGQICILR